jgi:hypothetical protein
LGKIAIADTVDPGVQQLLVAHAHQAGRPSSRRYVRAPISSRERARRAQAGSLRRGLQ